ncbi:MAG: hypothetical protein ABFD46_06455 [Armatimonadota bacterium]
MFSRTNKYAVLVLAVLLVTALVVMAAVASPGGARSGGKMCPKGQCIQQAAEKLGLTDAQKAQIQTIVKNHREQIRQAMQSSLTQEQKQAKVQELRKEMKSAIEQVLTPEQREKAKQMREEARKEMKQRAQERMKALGLTDEQLAEIKTIKEAGMEKVKAIRANTSLPAQERRSQIQAVRKDTHEQVMSVLTPEQREKFQQMHQRMGQGKRAQQGAACKLAE